MQLLIIAGGDSSRMRPLTTQKSIFPFLGKPFIIHVLSNLQSLTPSAVVVVGSPTVKTELERALPKDIQLVIQEEARGMADAVVSAKNKLSKNDGTLVVNLGLHSKDVVKKVGAAIHSHPTEYVMSAVHVDAYRPGGYFTTANGRVTGISEKPGEKNMPSSAYKLVFDYFPDTHKLVEMMAHTTSDRDDVYEQALEKMLHEHPAILVETAATHPSFKYPPSVLTVMDELLDQALVPGIDGTASIAPTAVVSGDRVQIAEGARILDHATVKGPCYIGKNVVVGNGALVRNSTVEEGSEVGYNSEIARSYIGPHTKCHTSYVGDSVVEGESNLAAGTVTANLRFDEKNIIVHLPSGPYDTGKRKFGAILARGAKTGIHASLMPGKVVTPGEIVGTWDVKEKG